MYFYVLNKWIDMKWPKLTYLLGFHAFIVQKSFVTKKRLPPGCTLNFVHAHWQLPSLTLTGSLLSMYRTKCHVKMTKIIQNYNTHASSPSADQCVFSLCYLWLLQSTGREVGLINHCNRQVVPHYYFYQIIIVVSQVLD